MDQHGDVRGEAQVKLLIKGNYDHHQSLKVKQYDIMFF